jgi:hypothetical protein
MAKPSNNSEGVLVVPEAEFNLWLQTYYLKPPTGTFVTWGKVKVKGDNLEVDYATSTEGQPSPPPEATTRPVVTPS